MELETLMARLRETGALQDGHFILHSGLHSDRYVQCALLLARPTLAFEVGAAVAARLPAELDLVVSPALGGIIIGHETAKALGVNFCFAERVDGKLVLRRGFSIPAGARVAVVEDVVTRGGSLLETAELVRASGGRVAAAAAIVDRSGGARPSFGAPFIALAALAIQTWEPGDCPLCRAGSAAVRPGSSKPAAR
jgi:orotate phosphoribosyltransferase